MKRAPAKRDAPVATRPPLAGLLGKTSKATQAVLAKIGVHRDFDLVLHLPLRYEDQTHLYRIIDAPAGQTVLVEGVVIDNAVKFRPKRQLVCTVEDDSGVVVIPQEMAEKVIEAAKAIEEAEHFIVEAVRAGSSLRDARIKFGYHTLQRKKV